MNTGVRKGCVLATHFNTCMNHVQCRMSENAGCGLSFGTVRITDLDLAEDAMIFAEINQILLRALVSLSEEAERLGLQVS